MLAAVASPHLPPSTPTRNNRNDTMHTLLDAVETTLSRAPATPLVTARLLVEEFARTAIQRDVAGGTPKAERDALRRSGLLRLVVPKEYGGLGASWHDTLQIVREIARVDSSVAHVFAFQHLLLATVRLFGSPAQWRAAYENTARRDLFWGNALNPLDTRTVCAPAADGQGLVFNGQKSFCSGGIDSDMLIASALDKTTGKLVIAALPTSRDGIQLFPDWDNMGQRQTDSGSASFHQVEIRRDEVLAQPGPLSSPFACLRPLIAQLILTNIYLGIAEGALHEARTYTRGQSRTWPASQVSSATQDPYVLGTYGEFWVALEGARLLTDRAARSLDTAWARDLDLSETERGEVAVHVASAKVASTRAGLDLTSRMFEVAGARATTAALRLDRFWRNLRTHSLHDPLSYKLRELGDWSLNDAYPTPTFYS